MASSNNTQRAGPAPKRRTALLLIASSVAGFLPNAARPDSEPHVVAPGRSAAAAVPGIPDLKRFGPAHQVRAISHHDEAFRVTTADGRSTDFMESDLHFKVDSSVLGPPRGAPVILPAGTIGDRAWVFFSTPGEIGSFITDQG